VKNRSIRRGCPTRHQRQAFYTRESCVMNMAGALIWAFLIDPDRSVI
jgi:hypothetical protein